jgi:hypothetical protein
VGGVLPTSDTPVVNTAPSVAASTGTPSSGAFTLVITAGDAELLGAIMLGLVLLLGGTRLVRQRRAARKGQGQAGTGQKQRRFWPWWPPSRWRAARGEGGRGKGGRGAATGALAGDSDGVAAHSGADAASD